MNTSEVAGQKEGREEGKKKVGEYGKQHQWSCVMTVEHSEDRKGPLTWMLLWRNQLQRVNETL